jgi:hypothetical protein
MKDAADRIEALGDEVDALTADVHLLEYELHTAKAEYDALTADNARLRGAIEYVLDGYGLNAPDFERQPEDDEDNWIVLTLRAALNTGKEPSHE